MPANPAVLLQGILFLVLLFAVSVCDIQYRKIPDVLQAGIAVLAFLDFSPGHLAGILCMVPYLAVALCCGRDDGIGDGPGAGPSRSPYGIGHRAYGFYPVWDHHSFMEKNPWDGSMLLVPGRPVPCYGMYLCLFYENGRNDSMKKKIIIAVCAVVPAAVLAAVLYRRKRYI